MKTQCRAARDVIKAAIRSLGVTKSDEPSDKGGDGFLRRAVIESILFRHQSCARSLHLLDDGCARVSQSKAVVSQRKRRAALASRPP
jgi:hypothetical protein